MDSQIKNIYNGLAILLVFVTILMNNCEKSASKIVGEEIHTGKKKELKNQIIKIIRFLTFKWIILLIINCVLVWILTPTEYAIIKKWNLNIFDLDINRSIFTLMYFIECYFSIIYIAISIKIFIKLHECIKAGKSI